MFDLLIKNGIIVTMEPDYVPFIGSVGVTDGRFRMIAAGCHPHAEAARTVDAAGSIVFPGLINGHVHGDMTVFRGLGDDLTLLEQNTIYEKYGYFLNGLTDEDRACSRLLTYAESLLSGCTYIVEHQYRTLGERSAGLMAEAGTGGAVAEDIRVDFRNPGQHISDDYYEKVVRSCREAGVEPMLSGYSEEYFDESDLRFSYEFAARHGVVITQHFAETDWRVACVKDRFGTTPASYLMNEGLLSVAPLVAGSHGVHVSAGEVDRLARKRFTVINTPVSEMKIADGIAPVPAYIEAGVPVGLGTDGALWNNTNDMFREVKTLLLLHTVHGGIRTLTARQGLETATRTGAAAIGMENEIGTISEGKRADFIIIDTKDKPHLQPLRVGAHDNVLSTLAYNVTGGDVTDVYVRGEAVVRGGKLQGLDVANVVKKVRAAGERVLAGYSESDLSLRP